MDTPHRCSILPDWLGRCRLRLLLCLVLALVVECGGAENVEPALRSIQQYWNLTPQEKQQPHVFQIECDVSYYDANWRMLWVEEEGTAAFIACGEHPLPVQSGQRIRVRGTWAGNLTFDQAQIEVVGPAKVRAQSTRGKIGQPELFKDRLVEVEGLVDRQSVTGPGYLHLNLSCEGRAVYAWVRFDPIQPVPQWADRTIRGRGVYNAKLTPAGQLAMLEVMVASPEAVEVVSALAEDPRFERPATLIRALATTPADQLVRVVGWAKAQAPGRFLRVRDETGEVELITGQTRLCSLDEPVEVIGYPVVQGVERQLVGGLYRTTKTLRPPVFLTEAGTGKPLIQVAAQVLELTPEEAMHGHPVLISGVVTWSHPDAPFFFVQDASGGVCINRGQDTSKVRPPGRNVEVKGVTAMGDYAPVVVAEKTTKLGDEILPEARAVSLEYAQTGMEEAQWVELRGYLRSVDWEGGWRKLTLGTVAGDFTAYLPPAEDVASAKGAVVRLYGVCTAATNEQRQITGIKLWVPSASYVQVEEAAPKDLFGVPACPLASLGRFGSLKSLYRWIKVSGVVLHQVRGRYVYIHDEGESLQVLSRDTESLAPGDRIEAVGFLGRKGGRVVLREATYRKTGMAAEPVPQSLANPGMLELGRAGQLVRLEGRLLDRAWVGGELRLTLQAGSYLCEAILPTGSPDLADGWEPGSLLALTGVYEVEADEYGRPAKLQLSLRSANDVVVVQRPSRLTVRRVLAFTGVLACGTLLVFAWVVLLRRRVKRQTEQIRQQMARELQLEQELQRATRLESLGVLAGGLAHDFNNLLTVVMGNVSLAALDVPPESTVAGCLQEATKAMARARGLTQQLLTFAKGGAPILSEVALAEVVRSAAEFACHGARAQCRYDFANGLWLAQVDRDQVNQVVQNLVLNAVRAMPEGGEILLQLSNAEVAMAPGAILAPGRYSKLSVTDHGAGLAAEQLPSIFDPYFATMPNFSGIGLATVYSIVKKHQGHITVESKLGQGTTFHVWLPAAGGAGLPAQPTSAWKMEKCSGRVLLMDDEEPIRRLGQALCQRLGLDAMVVADGAEAVRVYAEALHAGHPYDVVILDLTVPDGMGGKEAVVQLREIDPRVRVIVSSGYSNDPVLAEYRAHGFVGMVSKPYDVADMAHTLQRVLAGELT